MEYEPQLFGFEMDNVDSETELLGRNYLLRKINFYADYGLGKYTPIFISTSRGMGKTFLLKKLGLQQIKDKSLQSRSILEARDVGRVVSFVFNSGSNPILSKEDVNTFIPSLLIYTLCRMFDGK